MKKNKSLKTTQKQPGGITGKGFMPGQSGNPGGRPRSERRLLERLYGQDGEKVYDRLERLRNQSSTPPRLKAQIDFFIIERLHGRVQPRVDADGGGLLVDLLATVTARMGAHEG